jgi:hypothetical protein
MITSWFWLLANFAMIIAFFTFSPSVGKPNLGFVYLRNGLIPLIAAMNSREPAPVAVNAVVPVQTSHVQYTEEPGHYNYVQQAPTQVDDSLKKQRVPFRTLSTTHMAL